MISIIVPILNESSQLSELLEHLSVFQKSGCEIILVDGGSTDGSVEQAEELGFTVLRSSLGRAVQMNYGAKLAQGDTLLFLHADTRLPSSADQMINDALKDGRFLWGRFNVRISGQSFMFKVIAWFMNKRSRFTTIVTGDQAIFIQKNLFERVGGFPEQALMEDIELSKRLKPLSKPIPLNETVITSGRRWEQQGIWKTIFLMWYLRFSYWRGVSADLLVSKYR